MRSVCTYLLTLLSVSLLASLLLAAPASAQVCGSDRVEEIAPGLIYKVTSLAWSQNPAVAGSNIYLFKRTPAAGGAPQILAFGMGNGDGSGQGARDFRRYTGRTPEGDTSQDVAAVLDVITSPDCFNLPLSPVPVGGDFLIQHAHLDHANQEFVDAIQATDLAPVSFRYHAGDHQLLTCDGTFEGQVLEDGPYCNFHSGGPLEDNPFRGHPFEIPINLGDWDLIGSLVDNDCSTVVASYVLADGRLARVYRDTAHTSGGMNVVVDPFGGDAGMAFFSTTNIGASCDYPGFLEFVPHQ